MKTITVNHHLSEQGERDIQELCDRLNDDRYTGDPKMPWTALDVLRVFGSMWTRRLAEMREHAATKTN